jgi:hypothetical protein
MQPLNWHGEGYLFKEAFFAVTANCLNSSLIVRQNTLARRLIRRNKMTGRKTLRLRKSYDNGHPDIRLAKAEDAKIMLLQDIERLQSSLVDQQHQFKRGLESWHGCRISELRRPQSIHEDVHSAWVFLIFAYILTAVETALAYYLAPIFGIPTLFAILIVIAAIAVTKMGLHALLLNEEKPKESIRRLRLYVIAPSFAISLAALCVVLLARSLSDLFSDSALNLSLFGVSIGTLVLAAGLFEMAHLFFWSRRAERIYNQTERELAQTAVEIRYIERVLPTFKKGGDDKKNLLPPINASVDNLTQTIQHTVPAILLAAAIALTTACGAKGKTNQTDQTSNANPSVVTAAKPSGNQVDWHKPGQTTQMDWYLDWSLSDDSEAMSDAVDRMVTELVQIVEAFSVTRLTGYQFGSDGWSATRLFQMDLPAPEHIESNEAAVLFGKRKDAKHQEMLRTYHSNIQQQLSEVTKSRLMPPANFAEPQCTDINGVLARITSTNSNVRQIEVIFTDGTESCARELHPRAAPDNQNLALIIVLLPEILRNRELRSVQFEERKTRIQRALSWATVIAPHSSVLNAINEAFPGNNEATAPFK